VNPDLRNLIALQDLELNITGLQKQTSEIPDKIQKFESELARLRAEHDSEVANSKELANKRRSLEGEVEMLRTKLSRLKDQLMTVKTNKEYTAMLHEIQMAEDQIRLEEDKILDIMEKTEDMEGHLKNSEKEMLRKCAEIQEEIRKTHDSAPRLESELARLQQEKAAMESGIESELLARYRRIAKASKGVALAEARDELCSACHIRIRPQIYAELLRTDNIYSCDSCSRILFHRDNS
jgi:predicted  nucleic acid-binding Zn-ribbon protein